MIYKILGFFLFITSIGDLLAQAPQAIPFSAAVRNANGTMMPNKALLARFTIIDGSSIVNIDSSNIAYRETQTVATNNQGLFMINIGQGFVGKGIFANINWSVNNKYVQVEIDTTNSGGVYRVIGTQQLMSVPYSLNAKTADNGVPVGTVCSFMGNVAPNGWLLCDGANYSRTTFSNLFGILGLASGKKNDSTFCVPDMQGMFLRGLNHADSITIDGIITTTDPDVNSRIAVGPSGTGNSGNAIGSFQYDAFQGHYHQVANARDGGGYFYGGIFAQTVGFAISTFNSNRVLDPSSDLVHGSTRTSYESRPRNIAVNYIIKY